MRLQILELPREYVGSASHASFVLVASEVSMPKEAIELGMNHEFRDQIGAAGFLITPETVDIGPA